MNQALADLVRHAPGDEALRWRFTLACVERVRHLLEAPAALAHLDALRRFVAGAMTPAELAESARAAAETATRHPGSVSIDGGAHAAVSATHAVARALGVSLP